MPGPLNDPDDRHVPEQFHPDWDRRTALMWSQNKLPTARAAAVARASGFQDIDPLTGNIA
jgi:hypothetical protein